MHVTAQSLNSIGDIISLEDPLLYGSQGPKEAQRFPEILVLSHAALHKEVNMVCGPALRSIYFFHIVQGVAGTENKSWQENQAITSTYLLSWLLNTQHKVSQVHSVQVIMFYLLSSL